MSSERVPRAVVRFYRVEIYTADAAYGVPNPRSICEPAYDAADAITQVTLRLGRGSHSRVYSIAPWTDERDESLQVPP